MAQKSKAKTDQKSHQKIKTRILKAKAKKPDGPSAGRGHLRLR